MLEEGSGSHNFDSKFILVAISVEFLVIVHYMNLHIMQWVRFVQSYHVMD